MNEAEAKGWFYVAVNLGAFASTLATPWLLRQAGPAWAFGVPGVLMALATGIFWAGRRRFVHIPPGGDAFLRESFSRDGLSTLGRLFGLYLFVAVFWSLFDQTGSAWVLQAESLDRVIFGLEILPAQIQAANRMKSFVMAFFMMSIALGNLFTGMVNFAIEGTHRLQGADYYAFFTLLMAVTAVLFALFSRHYPEHNRLQSEAPGIGADTGETEHETCGQGQQ